MVGNPLFISTLVKGFEYLLATAGQTIILRNPVDEVTDYESPWYTTFEFYNEYILRAIPVNSNQREMRAVFSQETNRMEYGEMEWVFWRGQENASTVSRIGVSGKFYKVMRVSGGLYENDNPRLQHVLIGF